MARARIEIELTLSLDAMISLEEKRPFNFPPLSDIRVGPRVHLQGIFGYSSSLGGRTHTYTFLIGDPALLYRPSKSEDLSNQEAQFSCHIQVLFALEYIQGASR